LAALNTLGILGGSFNPPHLGHLALARHALAELRLGRVLLVPVYLPPHKPPPEDDPGPARRLAMCRALIEGAAQIEASTLEIDRRGRSYTVDTLEGVHASHPDAELTLILGADMACTLPSWRRPREILHLARLAVAERGAFSAETGMDSSRERVVAALRGLDPDARVRILEMPPVDVSSTMVRERLAQGEPVDDLVGPAVAAYITEHGLYGSARKAALR
jgi:nicotinate-nucleotide adenylyltransferase